MESKNSILFKKKPLKSIDSYKRKQKQSNWKENRIKKFTSSRSLDVSTSSELEGTQINQTNDTLDGSAAPEKLSRYQRLLKWKAEKEQRKLLEKEAKAPAFKIGRAKPEDSLTFGPASQLQNVTLPRSRGPGTPNTSSLSTPLTRSRFHHQNMAKSLLTQTTTTTKKTAVTPNTSLKRTSSLLHKAIKKMQPKSSTASAATPSQNPSSFHHLKTTKKKQTPTTVKTALPKNKSSSLLATAKSKPASTPLSKTLVERSYVSAKPKPSAAAAGSKSKEGDTVYLLSQAKKTPMPRMLTGSFFNQTQHKGRTTTPISRMPLRPRNLEFPVNSTPTSRQRVSPGSSCGAKPITSPQAAAAKASFAPSNFTFTAPSPLQKQPNFKDLVMNFLKNAPVFKYDKGLLEVNTSRPLR